MKSSRIMRNFAPAALANAYCMYQEDHFCIMIEKYSATIKKKIEKKLCEMDYFTRKFMKVYKL